MRGYLTYFGGAHKEALLLGLRLLYLIKSQSAGMRFSRSLCHSYIRRLSKEMEIIKNTFVGKAYIPIRI